MSALLPIPSVCCDPCADSVRVSLSLDDVIDARLSRITGAVSVLDYDVDPAGVNDSTEGLQDAIDAVHALGGGVVQFPVGVFKHSGLIVYDGVALVGAGSGRVGQGRATSLLYTGTGIAIQGNGAPVYSFKARHIAFYGTDGQGGTGLLLDSFVYASLTDVLISKWRNAGNTGMGLRIVDGTGISAYNRFIDLTIEDSDTALEIDSTNATHSASYNYFAGLVIYKEVDCILLKSTLANGGNYNVFDGVWIQGSPSLAPGRYIYIEGHGNSFRGVNVDQSVVGDVILTFALTNTADNYVHFIGGFELSKYVNNQTTGAENVVDFGGYFTHAPGKRFVMHDPTTTQGTELAVISSGSNASELHLGNDNAGSQAWRLAMTASATPNLEVYNLATRVMTWNWTTGDIETIGNFSLRNGQTIRFADTLGTSEQVLGVTNSNNVQLFSPTIGGDIQISTRAVGGAITLSPAAVSGGLRVDGNNGPNETRLQVYDIQTASLQRVKVGANGTGPGGVGRALYIDNI